jgi:predicted RNase H-like HicB family nuclease
MVLSILFSFWSVPWHDFNAYSIAPHAALLLVTAAYICYNKAMIQDFLTSNLNKARYEMIDDGKQFYGEIKSLRGVWAVGKTLEECRQNLMTTIEGWLIIRLKKNLPISRFKIPARLNLTRRYA